MEHMHVPRFPMPESLADTDVAKAFRKMMEGRLFGSDAWNTAWVWFAAGWASCENKVVVDG